MKNSQYPNNLPIGCYFDGAFGQECNDHRLLELAIGYGWKDDDATKLLETDELSEEQQDIYNDVLREAEDYLNSLETRPFVSWQWLDGDFGLYPDIESAREDCEFVSSREQDEPPNNFRGEWLHVNDHGNCTLYVRDAQGNDQEIWSVV